jgi:N-formylglutamate deformylase
MKTYDLLTETTTDVDELVTFDEANQDYITAVEHAGTLVPTDIKDKYTLGKQALKDTDLYTDELYAMPQGMTITSHLNRYVLNVNRIRETDGQVMNYEDEDALNNFLMEMQPALLQPLTEDEKQHLLDLYDAYHQYIQDAIQTMKDKYGFAFFVTAHSMNETSGTNTPDDGKRPHFDICTEDGTTTHQRVVDAMHDVLEDAGYMVKRNEPYSGGYTVDTHSDPDANIHGIQLEVNKALYMDENTFEKNNSFDEISTLITGAIERAAVTAGRL